MTGVELIDGEVREMSPIGPYHAAIVNRRYAQADISEVWLIDIGRRQIEQYTQPQGDQYAIKHTWREETTIAAVSIPTLQLLVDDLFP